MFRLTIVFLFLFPLLFAACDQKDKSAASADDAIIELHKKAKEQTDSSFVFVDRALSLAMSDESVSDSLRAESHYLKGFQYSSKGELDSAVVYYNRATRYITDQINSVQDKNYFYSTWYTYYSLGRYGDAIALTDRYMAMTSLDLYKSKSLGYYMYDNIYKRTKEYEKVLENNTKLVNGIRQTGNIDDLASSLISRAELTYRYMKDTPETYRILDSLVGIQDQLSNNSKRQLFGDYGVYEYYKGDFLSSYNNYKIGLSFAKHVSEDEQRPIILANPYANLAEVCIDLERYGEARAYLDSIVGLGMKNIDENMEDRVLTYEFLLAANTNNDMKQVQRFMDSVQAKRDQQFEAKYTQELDDLTTANENERILTAEKQEAEIRGLKLQNRLIFGSALAGALAIIGVLFYRQRKLRFRSQSLLMQQRLLRSQMNPHYTFNTLYAIQNEVKHDPKKASEFLMKFSRQLRLTLENSIRNFVLLEKELEALRAYLELQRSRFAGNLEYKIHLTGMEEDDPIFVPPMLLQPFVENSIEHGFKGLDHTGTIEITLSLNASEIDVKIEDNGRGMKETTTSNKQSTSLKLISEFLRKVVKKPLTVTNKDPEQHETSGVIVEFSIPFKETDDD